jgi:hypothetical protein
MAAEPRQMPRFPRGSPVLEYWLAHAEGLVVQPLGARVEEVVVAAAPGGRADTLIVRSRLIRRRRTIPAAAIAAVEPSSARLLLDAPGQGAAGRAMRRARVDGAAALAWLRPRVAAGATAATAYMRRAAAGAARGIEWLAPRTEHGVARLAQQAEHATLVAVECARSSIEAHSARRRG